MAYKMIDRQCIECGIEDEYLLTVGKESNSDLWTCTATPQCSAKGGTLRFVWRTGPRLRTSESASFVDGTARPGFAELKEKSRMDVQMAGTPVHKRKEIENEIRALDTAVQKVT